MLDTAWNVCRLDAKALEYAIAGALPVLQASSALLPYPPYDLWEGRDVALASTPEQFRACAEWCVEHPDTARELGAAAREYVLAERTIAANIGDWRTAIQGKATA